MSRDSLAAKDRDEILPPERWKEERDLYRKFARVYNSS